jgi:hypothetical protein
MVQDYDNQVFLAEVVNVKYDDLDPESDDYQELLADRKRQELDGGWWARAKDFASAPNNHTMIAHVSAKTWVDIDALELAVLHMLLIAAIRPDYDIGAEFTKARKRKLRWDARRHRGPVTLGDVMAEFLSDQDAI